MISPLIPHLILAGLVGIQSGNTEVNKVSVKAGGSISIPCLYEPSYRDHEKYLCRVKVWLPCSVKVGTNGPNNSGKFSISDDKNQAVFTVTINDVTQRNDGNWQCAVDKGIIDIGKTFKLSVTKDEPILYVDKQEVEAFVGGSVTVICYYKSQKVTGWCRLGNPSCVTSQTGSISGTTVTINASVPQVFSVTMSDLRTESSGWYFCTDGQFQIPVNVTVHESNTTTATTMIPSVASTLPTTIQHSSLLTSAGPITAQATDSTTNGSGEDSLQDEHGSSTQMTILVTVLVVLLLLVLAAFLGWWMIRSRKTKLGGSDITVGSQTGSDPDVHYATIVHNKHVAAQKKQECTPEESVTYSTIVRRDIVQQMTEPADGSVIYSTIVR